MTLRSKVLLCAAVVASAPAWAQSGSVTVYGVLDEALEYNSGLNGNYREQANPGQWRLGLGSVPSRLGFRGEEDLGGGYRALFTLESGLNVDTGMLGQGGRMFGRQSWVGLAGEYGTVSAGRQYTMRYYGMLDADFFGSGSLGLGTLDSGIPNARADNALSYRGTFGAFSVGAQYSFGRDAASGNNPAATNCPGESTDATQCREWSLMGKYDGGNWGLVSAYERLYGGTAGTYGGLTSPSLTDSRLTVNGYLKMTNGRVGLGWLGRDNEGSPATPKSNMFWLEGELTVWAPFVLTGVVAQVKFDNSPDKATEVALRANYWLSKRTTVYVADAYVDNGGKLALPASTNSPGTPPLPGKSQNAFQVGVSHVF